MGCSIVKNNGESIQSGSFQQKPKDNYSEQQLHVTGSHDDVINSWLLLCDFKLGGEET